MLKLAFKLIYRFGLRKEYVQVDRLRYLKRLRQRKHPLDDKYYATHDKEQFVDGEKICIAEDFLGKRVAFICDPQNPSV